MKNEWPADVKRARDMQSGIELQRKISKKRIKKPEIKQQKKKNQRTDRC